MNPSRTVDCTAIRADAPTRNGNVYSKQALERIVELTNAKTHFAYAGVQDAFHPNLADVAGKVTNAVLDDGVIRIQVEMLATPKGLLMTELACVGVPIMTGTMQKSGETLMVDPKSINLLGWSLGPEKL